MDSILFCFSFIPFTPLATDFISLIWLKKIIKDQHDDDGDAERLGIGGVRLDIVGDGDGALSNDRADDGKTPSFLQSAWPQSVDASCWRRAGHDAASSTPTLWETQQSIIHAHGRIGAQSQSRSRSNSVVSILLLLLLQRQSELRQQKTRRRRRLAMLLFCALAILGPPLFRGNHRIREADVACFSVTVTALFMVDPVRRQVKAVLQKLRDWSSGISKHAPTPGFGWQAVWRINENAADRVTVLGCVDSDFF